ncbi:MAG: phage virion morphogenesis protein [Thermoplasmataceae archaeon]
MMGVRGDFSKLETAVAGFSGLTRASARQQLSRDLAEEARRLVIDEFRGAHDPNGAAWAPLAPSTLRKRGGDAKILQDTRRLMRSITAGSYHATEHGFEIGSNVAYAGAHQHGAEYAARSGYRTIHLGEVTRGGRKSKYGGFSRRGRRAWSSTVARQTFGGRKLVARPFVPEGSLGPIWTAAFEKESARFMRTRFKGLA